MARNNGYKPMKYEIHPTAALLPMLEASEFAELKADIQAKGVLEPILMKGTTLIDGRNRMMACEELKLAPPIRQYKGVDEVGLILSRNVFRRHLSAEQRVTIIAQALAPKLKEAAEARMKAGDKAPEGDEGGEAADILAREAKTGQTRARQAIAVVTHGRASEVKAVISGKERLADVAREVKEREREKAIKAGKIKKSKPKPKVDIYDSKFIIGRFQKFMDYWPVTAHRKVKPVIKEFLS